MQYQRLHFVLRVSIFLIENMGRNELGIVEWT